LHSFTHKDNVKPEKQMNWFRLTMLAPNQHLVLRKIIKNLRTPHLLFCITYWKLSNRMSASYDISWNTDIYYKLQVLWPNNKYSLKVLWAKDQISSAYEKCQINDFKFDSSIFRIFTSSQQLFPYFQAPQFPAILR